MPIRRSGQTEMLFLKPCKLSGDGQTVSDGKATAKKRR